MAGGRRNPAFRASALRHRHESEHDNKKSCITEEANPGLPPPPVIRHIPLPDIPRVSVFGFECLMCGFSLLMLGAQYLNIYRTVFWLPHSYTGYAMNLYLIDPCLVIFIAVSVSRRLLWCMLKGFLTASLHHYHWRTVLPIARGIMVLLLAALLLYCVTTGTDSLTIKSLALAYPLALYLFIFDLELSSFLEVIPPGLNQRDSEGTRQKANSVRLVQHSCLNNSEGIRTEADFLANHCQKRLTLAIYHSLVNVYYTTLIPCFFVPNSLHYDIKWIVIHTTFVAFTCLMWHLLYCFPARFCDIIHRSVEHLGLWVRISSRSANITNNNINITAWQSSVMYSKGTVVKHGRDTYRAEASCNAAEPGNILHIRLYLTFHEVHNIVRYCLVISLLCSLGYLAYLVTLSLWHQLLATGIALGAEYAALYVLLRDYLVLRTTYKMEQ
uniref:Transmembrane protein 39A-like isoform X1 n=1 Tax=Hirondellea gigas TaxID=1518452 RepID=A0A6A7GBK5_9CRUS